MLRTFESVSITVEPSPSSGRRQLQKKTTMKITVKTSGTCSGCSHKAFVGNKDNSFRIRSRRRSLEETWHLSNCFCPLGSTVITEAPPIQNLVDLLATELGEINVPITAIVDLQEIDGEVVN